MNGNERIDYLKKPWVEVLLGYYNSQLKEENNLIALANPIDISLTMDHRKGFSRAAMLVVVPSQKTDGS